MITEPNLIKFLTEFKKLKRGFRRSCCIKTIDSLIKSVETGSMDKWIKRN